MFKTIPEAIFFTKNVLVFAFLLAAGSAFFGGDGAEALLMLIVAVLLRIEANTANRA